MEGLLRGTRNEGRGCEVKCVEVDEELLTTLVPNPTQAKSHSQINVIISLLPSTQ